MRPVHTQEERTREGHENANTKVRGTLATPEAAIDPVYSHFRQGKPDPERSSTLARAAPLVTEGLGQEPRPRLRITSRDPRGLDVPGLSLLEHRFPA